MVTATIEYFETKCIPANVKNLIAGVRLSTHFDVGSQEPVEFFRSVSRALKPDATTTAAGPTAQDIECLRQAAWKYSRQTAMPVATGTDLAEVLCRLGYI
jgi:hypothetical protein